MQDKNVMINPAFEAIQELQEYLPIVRGCFGDNLTTIKILDDLARILEAPDSNELSRVLHYGICQETERLIGFVRGYTPTVSIDKLMKLLDQVVASYDKQSEMNKTELIKLLKQHERLILNQEEQKSELQDSINDILEFTERVAVDAKQKARLTARASKQRFDAASDTIETLLQRRRSDRENPEKVDADKLKRVYWRQPEKYFR